MVQQKPRKSLDYRDIKAEHEKLAMDAWRSPRGALNDHSEDRARVEAAFPGTGG
jgi:hypothetical protein